MSSSAQLANAVQGARAVAAQGDVRGAFSLLDQALDAATGSLGGDDPDVLAATCVLAKFHTDLGELSNARRVLEEGLAAGYHRLGDGHAVMLALSYELARIADELGNVYEAKRRYGQLARLGPAELGEDHPSVRAARRYLGLPEPAVPATAFHAPHPSAPAPFEPLSAPTGTTSPSPAPPAWPVDQRPGQATPATPTVPAAPVTPAPGGGPDADDRPIFQPEPRPGDVWPPEPVHAPLWRPDEQVAWDEPVPREAPAEQGWQEVRQGVLQRPAAQPWPAPAPAEERHRDPWVPEPAPPRRRSPLIALLVILVVAVLGGVAAAVVSFVAARPDRQAGAPAPASAPPSATGEATPDGAKAPSALKLRDDKTSITLTWTDPSPGSVPFIVAGGQQGALRQLQVLAAGATTYTLNGLNPKLNYCFTVAAVYGTDSVALSDLACTQRK
ncbi:fibronectin type III domain-containing protein [Dactylosporangium sp. NPDC049742]|uniref:fibronectin type III domain-containing protein n=1 Tax=Dactylosporangium sp. NPDC049742 TaxID=3154737 RepID=UPI00341AD190